MSKTLDSIISYINNPLASYAILLDGEWGSGKTYFLKKELFPVLKEKKQEYIYVSLYGLSNLNDLSNKILIEIIGENMPDNINKNILKLAKLSNSLLDFFETFKTTKTVLKKIKKVFTDFNKYIYVFDDVERCSIPINDLMGYLNYFIEENDCKMILVANEKEIGRIDINNNIELKYLVSLNDKIKFRSEDNGLSKIISQNNNNKSNNNSEIEINTLKERKNELFSDNGKYMIIKEKLIGRTIHLQPNFEEVIENLTDTLNFPNNEIYEIIITNIKQNKKEIIKIFEKNNCYNIRTLKIGLSNFIEIISPFISEINEYRLFNDFLNTLFIDVLTVTIYQKKGKPMYNWEEKSNYGTISYDDKFAFTNYFVSFKFTHEFVYNNYYDIESIRNIIINYLENTYANSKSSPLNQLNYYWEMEDTDILLKIKLLYNDFIRNVIPVECYTELIALLLKINSLGFVFEFEINDVVDIMKDRIRDIDSDRFSLMSQGHISQNSSLYDKYYSIFMDLKKSNLNNSIESIKEKMQKILLNDNGWGRSFQKLCYENNYFFYQREQFWEYVDIDLLCEKIKSSEIGDFVLFRKTIVYIYQNNIKIANEKTQEIVERLSSLKIDSKIKKYNLQILIDFLEENIR